jgi:16S rRNA (cytidine1402-2'-O)-methyltransferase
VPFTGVLYLIPTVIADGTQTQVIPQQVLTTLKDLRYFLAEDIRNSRRYLSSLKIFERIDDLQFSILDKNTLENELEALMTPLFDGHDLGIISESGCPGVADPGAMAVAYAHQKKIRVIPLVGPSSVLLALMASGLNGQQFAFQGYLPIDRAKAGKVIAELERESKAKNQTQIFIETPYRNNAIFENLLKQLLPDTRLCVAVNLTSPEEKIICKRVREWRQEKVLFAKTPAIFLFLA